MIGPFEPNFILCLAQISGERFTGPLVLWFFANHGHFPAISFLTAECEYAITMLSMSIWTLLRRLFFANFSSLQKSQK